MLKRFKNHISTNWFVYVVIVASLTLRLWYVFRNTEYFRYLHSDMGAYDERAIQLLHGQYVNFSTYWAPFFHIFLAGFYKVVESIFGNLDLRLTLYVVLMAILNIITLVCAYKIAHKLFGQLAANISLILTALWYPLIYLNIFVLSENLFIPLMYLCVYMIICRRHTLTNMLVTGLIIGLATIVRPVLLLFLPMLALWYVITKARFSYVIGFTACVMLIVGLQSAYNFSYTHGQTNFITSGGGFNFALEWCDLKSIEYNTDKFGYGFGPPANIDYPEDRRRFTNIPFEDQSFYYDMGFSCIRDNPKVFVTNLHSVKNLFSSGLFPRYTDIAGWEQLHLLFGWLNIGLIMLDMVAILSFKYLKVRQRAGGLLLASLILSIFLAVYLQNPGEERYLYPYLPAMIILASYPLTVLATKLIQKVKLHL